MTLRWYAVTPGGSRRPERGGSGIGATPPLGRQLCRGIRPSGVEVLTATGLLDVLAFGSECGDTAALLRTAKALEGDVFQAALRAELTKGDSFAAARQRAVAALLSPSDAALLSDPNNTLGIEYCRALLRVGAAPALFTIPRTGAAHDVTPENAGGYSASAIRHLLAEGRRADALSRMVPAMRAVYEAEESRAARRYSPPPVSGQFWPGSGP